MSAPAFSVTIAAWNLIDFDEGDLSLLDKFDWWGLFGMAAFLGSLEYVLEEGPRNDWLQDHTIFIMSIILTVRGHRVLLPRLHSRTADRGFPRIQEHEFRLRLALFLCDGRRPLRTHLSLSALSQHDPRL